MPSRCPKCGFGYAWDGKTCGHCKYPNPGAIDDAVIASQNAKEASRVACEPMPSPPDMGHWRAELTKLIEAMQAAFNSVFQRWAQAEEPHALLAAAHQLGPDHFLSLLDNGTRRIEYWYAGQFDALVSNAASVAGLRPEQWLHQAGHGWLLQAVAAERNHLERVSSTLHQAALATAAFNDEHTGVGGFVGSLAHGWTNPIDSLLWIFDDSSLDREMRRLNASMEAAGANIDAATDSLLTAVDAAVVTRWNESASRLFSEIESYASPPSSSGVCMRPSSSVPQSVEMAPAGGVKARLRVVRGAHPNTEYPICEGSNIIGRADEQPVDIDLELQEFAPGRIWSSRQHAAITCKGGTLVIEDLGSANGTFVNRRRIPPGERRLLRGGDIIQIGEVQLEVLL